MSQSEKPVKLKEKGKNWLFLDDIFEQDLFELLLSLACTELSSSSLSVSLFLSLVLLYAYLIMV